MSLFSLNLMCCRWTSSNSYALKKGNKESYPRHTKNLTEIVNLSMHQYFAHKGELDSRNPNPPDLACTEPGPCQGMRGQKARLSAKGGK